MNITKLVMVLCLGLASACGIKPVAAQQNLFSNTPWIDATTCAGDDIGAQINDCNTQLDTGAGTVVVPPGTYDIYTQIVMKNGHSLHLGAGTYRSHTDYETILFQDNVEIWGDPGTVIYESDRTGGSPGPVSWVTIGSFNSSYSCHTPCVPNGPGNHDVKIHDLTIAHASPILATGGQSTVNLGNSQNVRVYDLHLNNTSAIGLNIGGSSTAGNHAHDVWVERCHFEGQPLVALSAVNAYDFWIDKNKFTPHKPNQGIAIDLEANTGNDVLRGFHVTRNIIDQRDGHLAGGIGVTGGSTAKVGPGEISNNVFMGEDVYGGTFNYTVATVGIAIQSAADITVANNDLQGKWDQLAMYAYSSTRIKMHGNRIQGSGVASPSAPQPAIRIGVGSTYCTVDNNTIYSPANQGGGDSGIFEYGTGNDYNVISHNILQQDQTNYSCTYCTPQVIILGAHSQSVGNIIM